MENYFGLIAKALASEDLICRINETNALIARMKIIEEAEKPQHPTLETLQERRTEIEQAMITRNTQRRRAIVTTYVSEILVDSKNKKIEGACGNPSITKYSILAYIKMAAPRGVEPLSRP